MTHINPDGKAVGGPQPDLPLPLVHVYSQICEHFDAHLVGNRRGLEELRKTIERALDSPNGETVTWPEVFATDGEGYAIRVKVLPDDSRKQPMTYNVWDEYQPHYCDRGYSDDLNPPESHSIIFRKMADWLMGRYLIKTGDNYKIEPKHTTRMRNGLPPWEEK